MLLLLRGSGATAVETTPQTHTETGVFKDWRGRRRGRERKIRKPSKSR